MTDTTLESRSRSKPKGRARVRKVPARRNFDLPEDEDETSDVVGPGNREGEGAPR